VRQVPETGREGDPGIDVEVGLSRGYTNGVNAIPVVPVQLFALTGRYPTRPIGMGLGLGLGLGQDTTKPLCLCNLQRQKDEERRRRGPRK
jgi:hypothetical protein